MRRPFRPQLEPNRLEGCQEMRRVRLDRELAALLVSKFFRRIGSGTLPVSLSARSCTERSVVFHQAGFWEVDPAPLSVVRGLWKGEWLHL